MSKHSWVVVQNEIQDTDGDLVFEVKPMNCTHDEAEARMRLIAAAPDMLAALRELVSLDECGQNAKLFRYLATEVKKLIAEVEP